MIQIIKKLEESGELKKLIKAGFMSTKVLLHYEVFMEYDKLKRVRKMKTNQAVYETAEKFGLCESSIYKIITIFKNQ